MIENTNALDDLLKPINHSITIKTFKPIEKVNPQFYAHIDIKSLVIIGIAPHEINSEEVCSIKIAFSLAEKFLLGTDNPTTWAVILRDDKYEIIRKQDLLKEKLKRIDSLPIVEITDNISYPDIKIEINNPSFSGCALIFYNGETIYTWSRSAKLYFTREGDPSYLQCAFTLDTNILNNIKCANNLERWPNPIVIPLHEADNISVYSVKSDIRIGIIKHETIN